MEVEGRRAAARRQRHEPAWDRPMDEWPRDDEGHGALVLDQEVDVDALVAEAERT